jgi:hypothetical protein
MAALNFPNSPSLNDTHTENGVTFKWNGAAWDRLGDIGAQGAAGAQGSAGAAGAQGATGPVAGSSSQVVYKDGSNNPSGSANFTFDGTNLTVSGNVSIGGTLTYEDVTNIDSVGIVTARAGVKVPDNQKVFLGTGDDLQIYHDSTSGKSHIKESGPGLLQVDTNNFSIRNSQDTEQLAYFTENAGVGLYYDNSKKFETTTTGISVTGNLDVSNHINLLGDLDMGDNDFIRLGAGDDLLIYHDGNNSAINDVGIGNLYIQGSDSIYFRDYDTSENHMVLNKNGSVDLYHNGSQKFETTTTGVTVTNDLVCDGTGDKAIRWSTSGTNKWSLYHNNGAGALVAYDNANNAERLRITSAGNVGINDTAPSQKLNVGGNIMLEGNDQYLYLTNVGTANAGIYVRGRDATNELRSHSTGMFTWEVVGSEKMRLTSDGFLGINVTSPSTILHVEQNNAHSSSYYTNTDAAILVDNVNASGKAVIKLEHDAAIVWGGSGSSIYFSDRESERLRINEYGNTIFQGQAGSFSNGNAGNAAILVRGKSVSGSSTTVDLNISQATSASGIGLEIQESTNTANALATLVFNHGSLKSMIGCSREATNNWGTDLRFYTHPTSTTSSDQHKVYERLRITSGGNVGINDTSPNKLLTVNRGTSDGDLVDFKNDEVSLRFGVWGTGATYPRQCTINATRQDGGTYPWLRIAGQDGIHFCSDLNNIRGNLNAYGEWRLGTSSGNLISTDHAHSIGNLNFGVTSNLARLVMQERQSNWISFKDGSSNHYGTISRNGSGVSYGSNSDYRLKDNVQNFTSGIELVKRLRPVTFNWNALSGHEDTTTIHRGFLAHEVQEIEPGAVDGEKDGMDRVGDCTNAEGIVTQKNVYESQAKDGETWTLVSEEIRDQQLDPAKLVPILTAGLKEAIAKIETLEAAVAALQGS